MIEKEQVYINLNDKYSAEPNTNIYVKDIAEVYCKDKAIKRKVEDIKILKVQPEEAYDFVSGNQIIIKILENIKNIDVSIIGGPDVLLEIKGREESKPLLNFLKVLVVSLILFFGSAIAIINFFEDVAMKNSLEKVHYIITGKNENNPKILTIPFSIGIGLGIYAFFNRIFSLSKRRRQEPGPLELELYLYDKNLEDNILDDLKKSEKP